MKSPDSPEVPASPTDDVAGTTNDGGGRRHLRLRRGRSDNRAAAAPGEGSEGPGQRRQYVRRTDGRSTVGSSAAIDITPAFPSGLRFFGMTFTHLYVNKNGNWVFVQDSTINTFSPGQTTPSLPCTTSYQ